MSFSAFVVLVVVVAIAFLVALALPHSILFALAAAGVIVGVSTISVKE